MAFLLLRLGIYISQICSAALMSVGLKVLRLIRSAQTDPCIPEAFHDLSEMSEIFAKTDRVHAEVCAELFFYGKALLEMSKIKSAVLENCLQAVEDLSKPVAMKIKTTPVGSR